MFFYIASPYSHTDNTVRHDRLVAVQRSCAWFLKHNIPVISPIAHCAPFAEREGMPTHWPFWSRIDKQLIESADGLIIIQMPGWNESRGVEEEIRWANKLGMEIFDLPPLSQDTVGSYLDQLPHIVAHMEHYL